MAVRKLVKKIVPSKVFKTVEPYGHWAEAVLAQTKAGHPARGLKIIGVTGTNGKTTTCFIIHKMLTQAGYKVGLMTTVAYGVGNEIEPQVQHMTTVSAPLLAKRITAMKKQGIEYLVLEVTSHALSQHRVWGVPFYLAVMTNVTHEHLDYHGSFSRYRDAKRLLFKQTNRNNGGLRVGIINADDSSASYFAKDVKTPLTYGIKAGNLRANNIKLAPTGSEFVAKIDGDEYKIKCNLPGSFNVSNSLAGVAVGRILGLTKKQIQDGIASLDSVEGRMERVDEGQNFDVIIDYAHTPDSFEKLFKDLQPIVTNKLITMFGSAGRRDEAKRAIQGEIAGKYCDEIIITEEDDRDMDGHEIMNQIAEGAEKAGKKREKDLFMVHNREQAIRFAFERAKKGDTVILLGKGHEKDILRNGPKAKQLRHLQQDDHNPQRVIKEQWDEVATAKKILKNILKNR
jgi:UDP-N-acetylmuramoyl-L-alanyl-D-glutamate--2,6-diaminopimelate ligase